MLAVQKNNAGPGVACVEIDPPRLAAHDQVRIGVDAVGICGSDVHAYEWSRGYEFLSGHFPRTLGHEFSGRVLETGAHVKNFEVGDRVTVWPAIPCGVCGLCRAGRSEYCADREIIGFHRDGGFCSEVVVPAANCFVVPADVDAELAALTEPLCVAANALEVSGLQLGDSVLVLGAGPIGTAIAWLAVKAGARVILAGKNDAPRLAVAARLGIDERIDVAVEPVADYCAAGGRTIDIVFEATGAPESVVEGLEVLRPGGVFVATGIHARPLELNLMAFVRAAKQLRASYDSRRTTWPRVLEIIRGHPDELRAFITHRLPLARAQEGFETARSGEALKVMLFPGGKEEF